MHQPIQIDLPGLATYHVSMDGITIEFAEDEAHALRLRRGTPQAGFLLMQGMAPLHASAVMTAKGALIFAGRSASGKSTLAAEFHQRGFGMLSDDLIGLELNEEIPQVQPGYAGITLWKDVVQKFNLDVDTIQQVDPELEKYRVTSEVPCVNHSVPVRAIFLLSVFNQPTVQIESVTGMEKFQIVGHHTYNSRLTDRLVSRNAFFALLSAIASSIPVWRLRRPSITWTAEQLADQIIELTE